MVGNLAENACEKIGANSLLARVGAYYHDIGKLKNPKYFIENKMPLGHGSKSLYLLQRHIALSEEEAAAIRWHMGAFEVGVTTKTHADAFAFQAAMNQYPLVILLHTSDLEACYLIDGRPKGSH